MEVPWSRNVSKAYNYVSRRYRLDTSHYDSEHAVMTQLVVFRVRMRSTCVRYERRKKRSLYPKVASLRNTLELAMAMGD